ncbi:MAG: hypothetical protein HC923_13010, partial [Myxococcales bacterium]|nr:hypothetical protein [Myxococcales bacterium]
MRRILVVAKDRPLTRFIAESLLGRSLDAFMPRRDDTWDVWRAHTGLEAEVLFMHGARRFDAMVIDQALPDRPMLELAARIRAHPRGKENPDVPRVGARPGPALAPHRDRPARRGRLSRAPVTVDTLRLTLSLLYRKRRVLLVEPDAATGERLRASLQKERFEVEVSRRTDDANQRLAPDKAARLQLDRPSRAALR